MGGKEVERHKGEGVRHKGEGTGIVNRKWGLFTCDSRS